MLVITIYLLKNWNMPHSKSFDYIFLRFSAEFGGLSVRHEDSSGPYLELSSEDEGEGKSVAEVLGGTAPASAALCAVLNRTVHRAIAGMSKK